MGAIHDQLRARRKQLGLRQSDIPARIGMARQQYSRLENGGNPSLDTLQLLAAGLELEVVLIPREKLREVRAVLAEQSGEGSDADPWSGILEP